MINNLKIKNFRCFADFFLERTGRITLVSGRNNVGKTALLESIFLVYGAANPDAFIKLNMIRGNFISVFHPDIVWEHFFHDRNMDEALSISLNDNKGHISATLKRNQQYSGLLLPQQNLNMPLPILPSSYPLEITRNSRGKESIGRFLPVQNGLTLSWDAPPEEGDRGAVSYIGVSPASEQNLAMEYGPVVKAGNKDKLLEILQYMEPEISDISTVAEETPRLYARKRNGPMLPLSSMGNGICRLVQILCALLGQNASIVLVDEIDSGIHYSFFPELWSTLVKLARDCQLQLFATTHSRACLEGAAEAFDETGEDCLYIRLGKDARGNILPSLFSPDMFGYALETDMEIR